MRADGSGAVQFRAPSLRLAMAGLGLAVSAATAASAAAPAGPGDAWRLVSGVFVGPDGVNLLPTAIAVGAVALIAVVGVVRSLVQKPTRKTAETPVETPAPEPAVQKPAVPAPARVVVASAPAVAPARASTPVAAPAQHPAVGRPAVAPPVAPAAAPAPVARAAVVSVKPLARKLPVELDRKPRDMAAPHGAPARAVRRAVKLAVARRGIVAHTDKSKLSEQSESTKRRPTSVPSGRRSALSQPSSLSGRRDAVRTTST